MTPALTGDVTAVLARAGEAPLDPLSVSPGVLGFAVTFTLAVVLWLLLRNMTGRLRGVKRRGLEAEEAERAQERGAGSDPAPTSPGSDS